MKKIERLRREALEACLFRKHTMERFYHFSDRPHPIAISKCKTCGMGITIKTAPPPNGIDIGGEAVALDCRRSI
jgi:ABC-type ATPase with predicted acetyltransferase domain